MSSLRRLWLGDVPLAEAFWTWAVLGGLAVNIITSAFFLALITVDQPVAAILVGYGLSVPYNIVVLVGVWRSADRYDGERHRAVLARVATLVGMLVLSVT